MYPVLFHLFGPISIHTYGVCIALGVIAALVLALRSPLVTTNNLLKKNLLSLINISIISGIIGGRSFYILTNRNQFSHWLDLFAVWDGGLSVLGTILFGLIFLFITMRKLKLPVLLAFDVIGVYAPLVQAFGRVGCFFAGCCHGSPTKHFLSITYTNSDTVAPLCVALHPIQLYNTAALLLIFFGLNFYVSSKKRIPGELILLSLLGLTLVRFLSDFLRGDRGLLCTTLLGDLSLYQIICLGFIIPTCILFLALKWWSRPKNPTQHYFEKR